MKWLQKPIDFLLYSNIFIGLCAVGLTFTNQVIVESEMHMDKYCWFIFFSTVFTYTYLKAISSPPVIVETGHRDWYNRNKQFARNIMLISLLATACFFLTLDKAAKLVVLALGIFTAFYGFINIPFLKPKKKLREFGLMKTVFVGIVWSVTTVIVPLIHLDVGTNLTIFLLLRRFLFILALTMVFEIKDMKGDAANNLDTIPVAIGVSNTKLIAQAILFIMLAINTAQYLFFDIPFSNMIAVNVSLLVSIVCVQPVDEETPEVWYYLVLDGMMIVQFALVYAAFKYFA